MSIWEVKMDIKEPFGTSVTLSSPIFIECPLVV